MRFGQKIEMKNHNEKEVKERGKTVYAHISVQTICKCIEQVAKHSHIAEAKNIPLLQNFTGRQPSKITI